MIYILNLKRTLDCDLCKMDCPICGAKVCCKPAECKVKTMKEEKEPILKKEFVVLKCNKCSSQLLVTMSDESIIKY